LQPLHPPGLRISKTPGLVRVLSEYTVIRRELPLPWIDTALEDVESIIAGPRTSSVALFPCIVSVPPPNARSPYGAGGGGVVPEQGAVGVGFPITVLTHARRDPISEYV